MSVEAADALGIDAQPRERLAVLVPELLLAGHLIDRAGMPHLIAAFGRDTMRDIAIDEWMGASPIYSKRMQRLLKFEGDSVETIFKNLQLDIGSPPQFMDFRFALFDQNHGEFWLDHCGALMDVEPMGPDYVQAMCHDIEDPTFDATATASNPRAQIRPIHRPPRQPANRQPHCAWAVTIDPSHEALPVPQQAIEVGATRAAQHVLAPIDPDDDGLADYVGPLLEDLRLSDFSASALARIAEEVCVQGHLLSLAFLAATRRRVDSEEAAQEFSRHQFTGVAGIAAERLCALVDGADDLETAAVVLSLSPALLPVSYTGCRIEHGERLLLHVDRSSAAHADGAWPSLLGSDRLGPLDAIVAAVNPQLRCEVVSEDATELLVEIVLGETAQSESPDVALTRFSTGAGFQFADRGQAVVLRIGPRG